MNEQRPKPVIGMKNELYMKLEFIQWALDEAKEAADMAQNRTTQAVEAMSELLSEDGPFFQRKRCGSCRTSWIDQRETPTVTHCPSCGRKAE